MYEMDIDRVAKDRASTTQPERVNSRSKRLVQPEQQQQGKLTDASKDKGYRDLLRY